MTSLPGRCYLNTYVPLAATPAGRDAAQKHGIHPFVDGSIRREPDLEHDFPAITCLCRKDKFAPRLQVGDTVGYMTVKRRFGEGKGPHRRFTALLKIIHRFGSHEDAADWYRSQGHQLPSNCLVDGNLPKSLAEFHRCHRCARTQSDSCISAQWDETYQKCARDYGTVLVCEVVHRFLHSDAPRVDDELLRAAFDEVPGTQNPGTLNAVRFQNYLTRLQLDGRPSVP